MPVTPDSGYQTMQFYYDPAKGITGALSTVRPTRPRLCRGGGHSAEHRVLYLLGYPNESPQKIEALTTPLTWTIDSITVARDAACRPAAGQRKHRN